MHVIDLVPADSNSLSYGIVLQSKFVHRVSGRGIHNPSFNHRLDVWLTQYGHDPSGRETDRDLSILLTAVPSVIALHRDPDEPTQGPALAIGDVVCLRIGGRREIGHFTIVAGSNRDPHLERISR